MSRLGAAKLNIALSLALALVLLLAAFVSVRLQPHRGPILVALSPSHGVDLADLAAVPALIAGTALVVRSTSPRPGKQTSAAAAASLACLGLLTGVLGGLDLSRTNRRLGRAFDIIGPAAFGVLAILLTVAVAAGGRPWRRTTRARVPTAVVILGVGLAVDVAALPSGTLFGPTGLAVYLATQTPLRCLRVVFLVLGAMSLLITGASLADLGGLDVLLARSEGGSARGVAFGAVALVGSAFEALVSRRGLGDVLEPVPRVG